MYDSPVIKPCPQPWEAQAKAINAQEAKGNHVHVHKANGKAPFNVQVCSKQYRGGKNYVREN
jgi:hypothetical protein